MGRGGFILATAIGWILLSVSGCGTHRKLAQVQRRQMAATISLPDSRESEASFRQFDTSVINSRQEDTMVIRMDGKDVQIMKAVRDEQTGEMVASEQINAAVVTARFRNVAERHGKVDLEFQVRVPRQMQDPSWQLRFYPDMYILEDSIRLDRVIITGEGYRRAQLRGYQQYERFLSRIVSDSALVNIRNLEIWLSRNLPHIYAFRADSSFVSDEQFETCFGYTEKMAVEHYTDKLGRALNERRKGRRSKMYARLVKSPILKDGVRLDTVMRTADGDFIYNYIQTITTRKGLKKVDIVLSGDIYESDRRLYVIPPTDPLTFYISSVSSFADRSPRYVMKVIERRAEANAAWNIDFRSGRSDIDESLGQNAAQIDNIRMNLRGLLVNDTFDLDSITIAAFASPEGALKANSALSGKRAGSAVDYFNAFVGFVQDSVRREAGMAITVGDDNAEGSMKSDAKFNMEKIPFRTSASGENWRLLDYLVSQSDWMEASDREEYDALKSVSDLDTREKAMQGKHWYRRMKSELYPLLRTVQFRFFLHRKGMVKDTVHTTVLDTAYMRGVQRLLDRDYEGALALLGTYGDYNTAIAYVSLDRNASALAILEKLPCSPQINYMLALLHSRMGDEKKAVQKYVDACRLDHSYVHRGNLDPEIASLIKKYSLLKIIDRQE